MLLYIIDTMLIALIF